MRKRQEAGSGGGEGWNLRPSNADTASRVILLTCCSVHLSLVVLISSLAFTASLTGDPASAVLSCFTGHRHPVLVSAIKSESSGPDRIIRSSLRVTVQDFSQFSFLATKPSELGEYVWNPWRFWRLRHWGSCQRSTPLTPKTNQVRSSG